MSDSHPISKFMSTNVMSFKPDTEIGVFVDTLLENDFVAAPIVDSEGMVVGMLSEKDCLKVFMDSQFNRQLAGHVSEYMTKELLVVKSNESLFDVIGKFMKIPCRLLPVVDPESKKMVGIISRHGALKAIKHLHD